MVTAHANGNNNTSGTRGNSQAVCGSLRKTRMMRDEAGE
jgi:hypothetical protein